MAKKSAATAQVDAILSKSKKKGGGSKSGGGARKIGWYGRSKSCQRYRSEMRWVSNKVKRVKRHLKDFPEDQQAAGWLKANS